MADSTETEHLHWGDGLVILGYFVAVISVGIWVGRRSLLSMFILHFGVLILS